MKLLLVLMTPEDDISKQSKVVGWNSSWQVCLVVSAFALCEDSCEFKPLNDRLRVIPLLILRYSKCFWYLLFLKAQSFDRETGSDLKNVGTYILLLTFW